METTAVFNPNSVFKRCRNSRCKAWLKGPVENPRNAFSCSGCEAGFYRGHCRVCEEPFEAKNSRKELCGRDSCEHEFQRNKPRFFSDWYPNPKLAVKPGKSSTKSTAKTTIKSDRGSDRGWVQIAGPKLSPLQFHCAIVGAAAAIGANERINPSGGPESKIETVAVDSNDPDEIERQVKFEYDRLLVTFKIGQDVSGCDLSRLNPKRVQSFKRRETCWAGTWRDQAWQAAVRIVMGETITGHADWGAAALPDGCVYSEWRPATGESVSTKSDDLSIPPFLRRTP